MSTPVTFEELARHLSEGLNLCVRARSLDSHERTAVMVEAFPDIDMERAAPRLNASTPHAPFQTRSITIPVWVQEQYERDLADWEQRTRTLLSRLPLEAYSASSSKEPS